MIVVRILLLSSFLETTISYLRLFFVLLTGSSLIAWNKKQKCNLKIWTIIDKFPLLAVFVFLFFQHSNSISWELLATFEVSTNTSFFMVDCWNLLVLYTSVCFCKIVSLVLKCFIFLLGLVSVV